MIYRIVDWGKHFENNRSRELKKLDWVPIPNKHDGDGYTEFMDHPDAASHLGAWIGIVQVASKCEPRGTLIRDGNRPHDAQSLSRITRIPASVIEAAISRLIGSIGWMEVIDLQELAKIPQEGAGRSHEGAPSRVRARARVGREGKGRERKGIEEKGIERSEGNGTDSDSDAFSDLTEEDLRSPAAMDTWFRRQADNPHPVIEQSESARLRVQAAAAQALAKATRSKVGLFVNIILQGKDAKITDAADQEGQRRLKELDAVPTSMVEGFRLARLKKVGQL